MEKKTRKALEKEIHSAVEAVLNLHDKATTTAIKKNIKSLGKDVAKKFTKELKRIAKKKKEVAPKKTIVRKRATKRRGRPRKQAK